MMVCSQSARTNSPAEASMEEMTGVKCSETFVVCGRQEESVHDMQKVRGIHNTDLDEMVVAKQQTFTPGLTVWKVGQS